MSTDGVYRLVLRCDHKFGPQDCPIWSTIEAPSRMEAKEKARQFGWMIAKNGKAFCEDHANERRASWR